MTEEARDNFFRAIHLDEIEDVKEIVAKYPEAVSWECEDSLGRPHRGLHEAIGLGHLEIVKFLLPRSGGPEAPDAGEGNPPMIEAIRAETEENHQDIIKYLLEQGADIHAPSPSGMMPLMCAAMNFLNDDIRLLLDYGADIKATTRRGSALHVASMHAGPPNGSDVYRRDRETIRLLLQKGAGKPSEQQALAAAKTPEDQAKVLDRVVAKYYKQAYRRIDRQPRLAEAKKRRDETVLDSGLHRPVTVRKPVIFKPK